MVAGGNIQVQIWRMAERDDDYVGGASISGTVVYQNLMSRMQAQEENQLVMQQGLETVRLFRFTIVPGNLDIRERDELEVTAPYDYPYYGDRFRILSVRYSDHTPRDPRHYMLLLANRSVRAHNQQ